MCWNCKGWAGYLKTMNIELEDRVGVKTSVSPSKDADRPLYASGAYSSQDDTSSYIMSSYID